MKVICSFLIGVVLGTILFYGVGQLCIKDSVIKQEPLTLIKEKIITKEVEVVKWKESKSKIKYRTKFDTLVCIDTIYAELIKCDTIVKIDSIIIAKQDTIIIDQKELIENCENLVKSRNFEIKKEKRKSRFSKVVAGVAIIVTILLLK